MATKTVRGKEWRECVGCKQWLPLTNKHFYSRDRYRCRTCFAAYQLARYHVKRAQQRRRAPVVHFDPCTLDALTIAWGHRMSKLSSKARNALPASEFALPASRKYPVNDRAHAANAKARVAQQVAQGKASPATKAKVDAKANKVLRGR